MARSFPCLQRDLGVTTNDPARRRGTAWWVWVLVLLASVAVFVAINLDDLRHRLMIAQISVEPGHATTLPFRMERGLVVVDATAPEQSSGSPSGKPAVLRMILDSAAFDTRVSADRAAGLGLRAAIVNEVGDTFGRTAEMGIASLPELTLGDGADRTRWRNVTVGILQWGDAALTPCVAPDGIVGGTLMRHAAWVIDFPAGRIHIGPPDRLPDTALAVAGPEAWHRLDMRTDGLALHPRIRVAVNGHAVDDMLVDTGSNGSLTLPFAMLDTLGIPIDRRLAVRDTASAGIFGAAEISAALAQVELQIGSARPQQVWATFTDDSRPKIGTKVLSAFAVAIVPGEDSLYLREVGGSANRVIDAPLRHGFIPGLSDDGKAWVVVYRERAATESGQDDPLAIGTRFSRINGRGPGETFASRCDWFMGVRELIDAETLVLEQADGRMLTLSRPR